MSALILDNFLPYADIVRSWALTHPYYTAQEFTEMYNSHTDWPGRRTLHVADLDKSYADAVLTQIANIAQQYFRVSNASIRSYFQLSTQADGDSWVHQDNDTDLAAVLYLSPDAPVTSGTTLYKCNDPAEWTSYMVDQEGYNTLKTINTVERTDLYNRLFTPVDVVGNVYNRLIMYPGITYHKSNKYFGNTLADGRLTQVFFIKGN
jgi:hypothetical protein